MSDQPALVTRGARNLQNDGIQPMRHDAPHFAGTPVPPVAADRRGCGSDIRQRGGVLVAERCGRVVGLVGHAAILHPIDGAVN